MVISAAPDGRLCAGEGPREVGTCRCSAATRGGRCSRPSTTVPCAAPPSSAGSAVPSRWACWATGSSCPSETDLALMLNVSTVTLRDALADLRLRGLVETRRGRGGGSFVRSRDDALADLADARLAELGTPDLREIGDVHGAVAAAAARLAAGRASPREIARLRDIVDRLARDTTTTGQRRADGRFYVEMAACAQSVRLTMQEMELHLELGQLPWPPAAEPALLAGDRHRAPRRRRRRRGPGRRPRPRAHRAARRPADAVVGRPAPAAGCAPMRWTRRGEPRRGRAPDRRRSWPGRSSASSTPWPRSTPPPARSLDDPAET